MNNLIDEQIQFIDNLIDALYDQRKQLVKLHRKEHLDARMVELFEIVRNNPGINRVQILALSDIDPNEYINKMTALRRHNKIVNLGTRQSPSWFVTEN
jgi:hypothetical protein